MEENAKDQSATLENIGNKLFYTHDFKIIEILLK
jgi:hypothetical protein